MLTVSSGTLGAYRHFSQAVALDWKFGGGFGIYSWNYKYGGKSIRDPETQLHYRGFDPGLFIGGRGRKATHSARHTARHRAATLYLLVEQ